MQWLTQQYLSPERKGKSISSFSNVSQDETELMVGLKFFQFDGSQQPIEQVITKNSTRTIEERNIQPVNRLYSLRRISRSNTFIHRMNRS